MGNGKGVWGEPAAEAGVVFPLKPHFEEIFHKIIHLLISFLLRLKHQLHLKNQFAMGYH